MPQTKIQGKFYPLKSEEWLDSINQLTHSELKILYYVRSLDPYNNGIDITPAQIARDLSTDKNEKYVRRQLIASGHEIVELGYDNLSELEDVINDSQKKVLSVGDLKMNHETDSTADISAACFNELESNNPIYESGLYDLDDLMVGFEPGTMTILAGRPSMGKSAIANFFTLQMAAKHKLPAVYFSLEMTK